MYCKDSAGGFMKRALTLACGIFLLVVWVTCAYAARSEIRILHVNDFHGFAEPYKPFGSDELYGGIARLAAEANKMRREKPSLLLAAGDMISGNNWANVFQGKSVIELMNLMKFDAMTVGNHEFDFGRNVLKQRITEAKFPVLGANVEGLDLLKPYMVRELVGVRIAVIGVVTEDTPVSTHPKNVLGLKFDPPIEVLKKYLPELRRQADIIVVLSHTGFTADRMLAQQMKGIDIIVGGHSHTKVDKPVIVGNTIIVQAWEHARALGVLDLIIEDGRITGYNGRLVKISPDKGEQEPAVQAIVDKYRKKVDAVMNGELGKTEVDLDGENVRRRETNLGDLIADIVRRAAHADAAILNGGGIRTGIKKGEIRMKDIYSVLPFGNYIVAVTLTGKQIKEALEHGVSSIGTYSGAFPQVSGINFVYAPGAPVGNRILKVCIAGRPIVPDREYVVATNDFLAAGGDGYKVFGDAVRSSPDYTIIGGTMKGGKLVFNDAGRWLRDVVADYIKEQRTIAPRVENRITEIR